MALCAFRVLDAPTVPLSLIPVLLPEASPLLTVRPDVEQVWFPQLSPGTQSIILRLSFRGCLLVRSPRSGIGDQTLRPAGVRSCRVSSQIPQPVVGIRDDLDLRPTLTLHGGRWYILWDVVEMPW